MNVIEILNELTVLVAAYPLLTFTDWVGKEEDRIDNGWYLINCICLNVMFNISVSLIIFIHESCRKLKFYRIRRRKLDQIRTQRLYLALQVQQRRLSVSANAQLAQAAKKAKKGKSKKSSRASKRKQTEEQKRVEAD